MHPRSPEAPTLLTPEGSRAVEFVNLVFNSIEYDWRERQKEIPEVVSRWKRDTSAALEAFMLGAKPGVLVDTIKDPKAVEAYLSRAGKDALVYKETCIADRALVRERIEQESELAQELGWQESMTVDEWLSHASPGGDGVQRGIIGFFLGYPASAIRAYSNKQIKNPVSVVIEGPQGGRAYYFTTDATLQDAPDVKALTQKTREAFVRGGFEHLLGKKSD